MPYIGNNHIAGDHTNNFKVLDDISSYTATFDGSATSVVDTTNNTIRVVEHRFIQGQRVTYTNGGGGNIGGLTTGTAYFIIHDSASTFKLATSASNAASSTAINLSAVGSGSSHTLNAAFDGVNTKFKLTHSSGTGARLNNATQVNVAINNVLQKPNQSASYTEGFIIEDNHKIAFKTAPTSEDIFWGSIIANTLTTFDISDHKIDTFTGDGSTTEFNLSHTPANNESLMVTINGVLQHPSNASTARAYTLIANVIQFTAAPGVGDEIQVRHMGFAGATTSDVTGFYGRTGNVVLTSNDHITTGNINAGIVTATTFDGAFSSGVGGSNANFTGIVTAGTFKGGNIDAVDGAFSGNVTIGGTLTYEDVSNIDSVGIVTAQKDVHVGAGLSVVGVSTLGTGGSGQVFLQHQGSTRLETTSTGIKAYGNDHLFTTESTGDCRIILQSDSDNNAENDNSAVVFRQDGSADIGAIGVNLTNSTSIPLSQELFVAASSGESAIILATGFSNGYNNAVERVRINNAGVTTFTENVFFSKDLDVDGHTNLDNVSVGGATTISNNLNVTASIDVGLDLDVDGHTNLDNVSVAGVTTMSGNLTISNTDPRIIFVDTNNNPDFTLHANGGEMQVENSGSGTQVKLESSGSTRLFGNVIANKDLDVDGHTNLDNVSIAGVTSVASLTSGRVVTVGTAGKLQDSANLTFDGAEFDINNASGSARLYLISGNSADSSIYFGRQNDGATGGIRYEHSNDSLKFMGYNNADKMVIDSSGNVLVGTTDTSVYNNGSGNGIVLRGGQVIDIARSNDLQLTLNRMGNDGPHIAFYKGGGQKSFISTRNNAFCIDVNGTNERLRIQSDGKLIISTNANTTTSFDYANIHFNSDNSTVAEGLFINNIAANTGDNASISFSTDSGNRHKSAISHVDTGAYGRGDLVFSIDPDADSGELDIVAHEKVRITSAGQFLMGTTSSTGARVIIQQNSSDTNPLDQQTCADSSGMRLHNYSFGTGRYTALSLECCNSSSVQSASIVAQSVSSGTSPDIIFTQRTSNTANSERVRIKSDSSLLHTRTDNVQRYDVEFRNTGGISNGNYGGIRWSQNSTGGVSLAAIEIAYADSGRPDIVFKHRNRGGGTTFDEAMRIDRNAKIGINNSSPECRSGGIDMSSNVGTSGKVFTDLRGESQLIIRNPSTTQHSFTQLLFENGGGTSAATMLRHRLGPSSGNQQNFVGDLCLFRRTGNAGGSNNDYRESTRFCGATEQARQIWWASGDTDTAGTSRLGWHHLSASRDHPGTDAYTFFRLETGAASYARNGMGKYTVVWTTGHASGYGLQIGHFGYYMHHGSSTIVVNEHIIHRERYSNGSYYGWNDAPNMRIINSSASGGTNGCIVFRCGGRRHSGFDMGVVVGLFVDLYVPESANGDSNPRLYVAGNSESNLSGGGFGNPVSHAYVSFQSSNPNHSGQP